MGNNDKDAGDLELVGSCCGVEERFAEDARAVATVLGGVGLNGIRLGG